MQLELGNITWEANLLPQYCCLANNRQYWKEFTKLKKHYFLLTEGPCIAGTSKFVLLFFCHDGLKNYFCKWCRSKPDDTEYAV